MKELPKVTVDDIMNRIRAKLSKHHDDSAVDPEVRMKDLDWNRIDGSLGQSERSSNVWTTKPNMDHYPLFIRGIAKVVGKVVLYFSQVVTKPQERFNVASVRSMHALREGLEIINQNALLLSRRLDKVGQIEIRIADIEQRVSGLDTRTQSIAKNESDISELYLQMRNLAEVKKDIKGEITDIQKRLGAVATLQMALETLDSRTKEMPRLIGDMKETISAVMETKAVLTKTRAAVTDAEAGLKETQARIGELEKLEVRIADAATRIESLSALQDQVKEIHLRIGQLETLASRVHEIDALQKISTSVEERLKQTELLLQPLPSLPARVEDIRIVVEQLLPLTADVTQLQAQVGSLSRLSARVDDVTTQINVLPHHEHDIRDLSESVRELNTRTASLARLDPHISQVEDMVLKLSVNLQSQERRLFRLLEETHKRLPKKFDKDQLQKISKELEGMLDDLYVAFEDQFRGTRADIKNRSRIYLPVIQKASEATAGAPIVDIGCGRGEWLELLRESSYVSYGVDTNATMVAQCQALGLKVFHDDALEYLDKMKDKSLAAVTGFHVIEHLPFTVWVRLFDEVLRVLKPGGVVIFETPNPENVQVGSNRFYLDPTHHNPLPSHLVKFIAGARGFGDVEVRSLHPFEDAAMIHEQTETSTRFNAFFYGPQDYAIIAWKT
ncbi:MAG: methyltransferase domain-containing protein [Ignavibacteria bacterium]|nr:methyltransferase domain-containing protein [Ignavibacteria bacterium]